MPLSSAGKLRTRALTAAVLVLPLFMLLWLSACNSQDVYNTQAQDSDTAETNAKIQLLQPVVGTYCGKVHLLQSSEDFDANLSLQIIEQNTHSSTSQDPTDIVRIPTLGGSLSFPAIASQGSAAYSTLPDLMEATGGFEALSFNYGDYNSTDHSINLPFTLPVAGFPSGTYTGALTGTLSGDTLNGDWFSENSRRVGTFQLTKCNDEDSGS